MVYLINNKQKVFIYNQNSKTSYSINPCNDYSFVTRRINSPLSDLAGGVYSNTMGIEQSSTPKVITTHQRCRVHSPTWLNVLIKWVQSKAANSLRAGNQVARGDAIDNRIQSQLWHLPCNFGPYLWWVYSLKWVAVVEGEAGAAAGAAAAAGAGAGAGRRCQ